MRTEGSEQLAAEVNEHGSTTLALIEAPKQFLARRLDSHLQTHKVGLRWITAIGIGGATERLRRGRELGDQVIEEHLAALRVQDGVGEQRLGRQPASGNLAALR